MKHIIVGLGVLGIAVLGMAILNNTTMDSIQESDTDWTPQRRELSGTYLCLPPTARASSAIESECIPGIETDDGVYYAVDFMLMSQTHEPFLEGDTISASGVVTPAERLSASHWRNYPIEGIFSVTSITPTLCSAEAMMCPDGTSVGRVGPRCEFAVCPSIEISSSSPSTVILGLGQSITTAGITIKPTTLVNDSRCPNTVQCIWAGTVEIELDLSTTVAHGGYTIGLGESREFDNYRIRFTDVTPEAQTSAIDEQDYRFTFEIDSL